MRSPTSLADLVLVAGILDADATTLARAAAMLGLATPPPPSTVAAEPVLHRPAAPPPVPISRRVAEPAGEGPAEVRPAGDDPRPPRRVRLVRTEPPPAAPPRPLRGTVSELLPPAPVAHRDPEPLLEPAHQRAVLSALAAIDRAGREVDVDALVEHIAGRTPIEAVPRLRDPTTRLGVQLLIDRGPSMAPFRRDARLLEAALRRVIGADAVAVLGIRGDPLTVLPAGDEEPGPFVPVGPRPILLASDLGIAAADGATRPAAWLRLAGAARDAGCPLVVLVPYPPARWPHWALGRLSLVPWDRSTDAGHARRAARRAAQLAGIRP